ncbi:MAG: (2Fe-2S)-binding protein [Deltaproteobacteria bacterium RIFCSPLOWO2_12_FULL_60_19]|nr:MAG: (2Fe-2S)-binding protein [Deltaproteobacteria bacterium RIFCSPLOWO2_12_FULL_60_19]
MKQSLELTVNGQSHELLVDPHRTLLEVLREQLGLTGAKEGCNLGDCGSCTVLLDGKPFLSCLVLAVEAQGREILTIEGLSQNGKLHPIQESFVQHGAVQCGFCTPGMILSAKALLDRNPRPTEAEVKEALSGNLCRCTGYVKIVEAIMETAKT